MNCPNCGAYLPDDSTFCDACGTPIAPWQLKSAQTEQPAQSVNDALFNAKPVYTSNPVPQKKSNSALKEILIGVAVIAAILFAGFFVLGGRYNGTYEFESMYADGMEFTAEQLEEISGTSINMSIKVVFTRCIVDMDMLGYDETGTAKFRISNNKVTLSNSGKTPLTGTYNSAEKSITISADGVEMKFVKK